MKFQIVNEIKSYNMKTKIKVIGIGGAGGNAINNMINANLQGVDFIVANTDAQDLERSLAPIKIQLGPNLTLGLGAGGDPDIGMQAAEESIEEIRETLENPDMVFITAGMGGGTGTGASAVIAKECKNAGALTVAVVTKPFKFEGDNRMKRALAGIEILRKEVDSLIVIPNERLKSIGTKAASFKELLAKADDVLLDAVRGISDLITSQGFINLDFADVKKVMEKRGTALMGRGGASGDKRALEAAQTAINSPLLEDISIKGAKGLLINITGPSNMSMEEIDEACNYLREEVSNEADIYWGVVFDDNLGDEVQVTVIATGIDAEEQEKREDENIYGSNVINLRNQPTNQAKKELKVRDVTPDDVKRPWSVRKKNENNEIEILYVENNSETESNITDNMANSIQKDDISKKDKDKEGFFSKLNKKINLDYPTFLRTKTEEK